MIIKSKEKLANRIGLIHIYGDAKKFTLSTYFYHMRIITNELSVKFKFNNFGEDSNDGLHDIQYLTPGAHKHFLKTIVVKVIEMNSLKKL
jgi:hypothetical protein